MRICFFGDARNVHVQRGAAGLADRGHDVFVVSRKPAEIAGVTVEVFAVPPPSLGNLRRWDARRDRQLRGYLRRFDVVLVCFLDDWGFKPEIMSAGCLVAFPFGSDIVHPPGSPPLPPELTARRVELLHHAHAIATAGPRFARIVAQYAQLPLDRVDVMPIGVDLDLFRPRRRPADRDERVLKVGFFKGFRRVYGAPYLMRAMPTVLEELPHVRFELIGDGPELLLCKQMAGLYGVESAVRWRAPQPHRNLPNFLDRWDLSVIPSLCESFGVAALESAAMQVPVIASDVGGLPDTVLHDETGLLVPAQAPEALADALITLLHNKQRRLQMGLFGRAFVQQRFAWPNILEEWEKVLRRARDQATLMV